ncbi:YceI family protein [Kangiella geojedonensis]|uniref:YceI family protein n=1 Tax=Kangiella geojedonensis TaxID=914150 RepID=A0A0F6TQ69_9GAMM|nr:YceI family protein [Kangiella geojedonensis]AKE51882.1 YceI family protein [Kangiella geojedonensis]
MLRKKFLLIFASLILLAPLTTQSKEYTGVVAESSKIEFSGVQNRKTAFTGHFKEYEVSADFDSGDLSNSYINVMIELGTLESGSEKRDTKLKKGNWFDIDNTPRSYFKSESIKPVSDGIYEIEGLLEIKGISKPYSFTLEIRELVDLLKLSGNFTINRLDFDLGLGAWKNPDWVKHEVEVEFDITVKKKTE